MPRRTGGAMNANICAWAVGVISYDPVNEKTRKHNVLIVELLCFTTWQRSGSCPELPSLKKEGELRQLIPKLNPQQPCFIWFAIIIQNKSWKNDLSRDELLSFGENS